MFPIRGGMKKGMNPKREELACPSDPRLIDFALSNCKEPLGPPELIKEEADLITVANNAIMRLTLALRQKEEELVVKEQANFHGLV